MDQQEGLATKQLPLFKGENYAYWSVIMECNMMSLGWKVFEATEREYKNIKEILPTNSVELGQYEGNEKVLNSILSGLANTVFVKFMQCKTTK